MKITVAPFEDFPLNSYQKPDGKGGWVDTYSARTRRLYSKNAVIDVPGRGYIGRVDHFMITSMKQLVNAYVRQVVKREGVLGTHTVIVALDECQGAPEYLRKPAGEVRVQITAQ